VRVIVATDFWFWTLCVVLGAVYFERWARREVRRLQEARKKALEELLAKLDKELTLRMEAWKILQNMEPELCARTWEIIKDRTLQHWLDGKVGSEHGQSGGGN
jgi:hypothetical protein